MIILGFSSRVEPLQAGKDPGGAKATWATARFLAGCAYTKNRFEIRMRQPWEWTVWTVRDNESNLKHETWHKQIFIDLY